MPERLLDTLCWFGLPQLSSESEALARRLIRALGGFVKGVSHMKFLIFLIFIVLGILSMRRSRWAYITFVVLGLFYFPASVGFRLNPQPCNLALDMPLAIHSLTNYAHIVLFVWFFLLTSAQFRMSDWQGFAWAALAAITMGAMVELAEGISGKGHCRLRDLIPDGAGILLGSIIVWLWHRLRKKPSPGSPAGGEEVSPNNSLNRSAG
jgi:hypothetical protein